MGLIVSQQNFPLVNWWAQQVNYILDNEEEKSCTVTQIYFCEHKKVFCWIEPDAPFLFSFLFLFSPEVCIVDFLKESQKYFLLHFLIRKKKFPKFSACNSNGLQVKQALFDTNITKRFSTVSSECQPTYMLGSEGSWNIYQGSTGKVSK